MARGARATMVAALLAAAACVRHGTSPSPAADGVLAADRARAAAMVAGDAGRLDTALDDSLTYTHADGRVDTKASLMAALASGRVDYRRIEASQSVARRYGEMAIVSGPVWIEVAAGGRVRHLRSVYTAVYRRYGRRWRLVAYHSSPVR